MNVAYIITSRRHVAEYELAFFRVYILQNEIVCVVRLF